MTEREICEACTLRDKCGKTFRPIIDRGYCGHEEGCMSYILRCANCTKFGTERCGLKMAKWNGRAEQCRDFEMIGGVA